MSKKMLNEGIDVHNTNLEGLFSEATKTRDRIPSALSLLYLDIKGLAEPIRLALAIGNIPFEDRRVSYDDIARMRDNKELPFGQVPVLDVGGVRHGQSMAILRWAGRKAGLYPLADDECMFAIDEAMEAIADIHKCFVPAWYKHAVGRSPTGQLYEKTKLSHEQNAGVREALNEELLPARFMQLEERLVLGGGPFICGTVLTIADLSLYVLITGIQDGSFCDGVAPNVIDACPALLNLVQSVARIPEVAAWEAAH